MTDDGGSSAVARSGGYYTGSVSTLTTQAIAGKSGAPTEEEEATEETLEVSVDVMENGAPAEETVNEGATETDAAGGDAGSAGGDGGGGD